MDAGDFRFGTTAWRSGGERVCRDEGTTLFCRVSEMRGDSRNRQVRNDHRGLADHQPRELCAKLGWQPGTEVAFIPKGSGALLIAVPEANALHGIM